jgi:hypothetical protein
MSDTWQYRIRVYGAERARWAVLAQKHVLRETPLLLGWPRYDQPIDGVLDKDGTFYRFDGSGTWFNVEFREQDEYVEISGNFSSSPAVFFDAVNNETALFGSLRIEAEIVGYSWSCDSPTGVYSYCDRYANGRQVSTESSNTAVIAERCAPELLLRFPENDE